MEERISRARTVDEGGQRFTRAGTDGILREKIDLLGLCEENTKNSRTSDLRFFGFTGKSEIGR